MTAPRIHIRTFRTWTGGRRWLWVGWCDHHIARSWTAHTWDEACWLAKRHWETHHD